MILIDLIAPIELPALTLISLILLINIIHKHLMNIFPSLNFFHFPLFLVHFLQLLTISILIKN